MTEETNVTTTPMQPVSLPKNKPNDALSILALFGDLTDIGLGVSSVWKADKGLQVFLELAQAIPPEYQVVLVGVSHSQRQILPKSVIAIERTENTQELATLYTLADVLVNASKEETFGMVPAEAMACGTPVIVSSQTACPEIVDQDVGLVVSMESIKELMDAIDVICTNGKEKYSDSCVSRVKEYYSVDEMNSQYYDLYRKIEEE